MSDSNTKRCTKCGGEKSLDQFGKRLSSSDGLAHECLVCKKRRHYEWSLANPEKILDYRTKRKIKQKEYNKQYYDQNKSWWVRWRADHPEQARVIDLRYKTKLRAEVIAAYGGRCSCCGEWREPFLTLEHVGHDGKAHRVQTGGPYGTYRDLKKRGWPKNGYTILCWNCQMVTRYGATCPHKEVVCPP